MNRCQTLPPSPAQEAHAQKRILCVDGSSDILEICRIIFQAAGYQVGTFRSGGAAIEFLKWHAIDAVIVDDTLPDMSGSDFASAIKRLSESTVVVMYSSRLRAEENIPCVDSYLSKGRGPLALRSLLDSLTGS